MVRFLILALCLFALPARTQVGPNYTSIDLTSFAKISQVPGLAPVQSVNGLTGAVTLGVSVKERQIGTLSTFDSNGQATWTFGMTFSAVPSCYFELVATNTNYIFAAPRTVAKTTTAITIEVEAALKILSISLGLTTIWTTPPAGTQINASCLVYGP